MEKPKVDVLIVLFCYGGNGGVATILPEIGIWLARLRGKLKGDDRIGRLSVIKAGDTPLPMERNRVVKHAKDSGYDVLVMLDSDNLPDLYLGSDPKAKPFFETSFDFLYERTCRDIPTVVCAPYCGPPSHPTKGIGENVYVFYAVADGTEDDDDMAVRLDAYSREHAATMVGIQMCAAGPTGCIMYSLDAFDLMPLHGMTDEEILRLHATGKLSMERAKRLIRMDSWFFYEYTDQYQTQKASTEDVTNTREIQFAGTMKHGEPIVFCNWDAWAGHYKPKCVGKPQPLKIEQVSSVFLEAAENKISVEDQRIEASFRKV